MRRTTVSRRSLLRSAGLLGTVGISTAASAVGSAIGRRRTGGESLPTSAPRVLHREPATAPQFENEPPWRAEPLRVAGTDAYVDGEYLYQDYVYDDYGANTTDAPGPPQPAPNDETAYGENGTMTGDLVYPTDAETFRHNAADLLEFRAKPAPEGIRYRITLNTMVEPDVAGVAIGIDVDRDPSAGADEWGYGIGSLGPLGLDHVLVTWGTGAELDGAPVESSIDLDRNQIEVAVPLDPEEETWRHYVAVGLFDADAKRFRDVRDSPDERRPGGAHGRNPPPIFNVGFRFDEPVGAPNVNREAGESELEDATETGARGVGYGHWRDHAQAEALAARDVSAFHADVDFGKLRARTTERHVPRTGFLTRLYASHYDLGAGVDADRDVLRGRIQPYGLYVPHAHDPSEPTPLHLQLHSLGSTYNEYAVLSPNLIREFGERRGAIVLTPEARGPAGWYTGEAELDVFEAWGDVAARYDLDFDRTTIGGFSMGAFGTFRLGSLYPDLFARAFAINGGASATDADPYRGTSLEMLDGLRNVPVLMWNGSNDQLVPAPVYLATEERLRELDYRHELDAFLGYDHFTFAFRDRWGPAREFLGDATVERSPRRVRYRRLPAFDGERFGLIHDGAHWVSEIETVAGAEDGLVDARSLVFGEAPPRPAHYEGEGTEPDPHAKRGTVWKPPLVGEPARNALVISLERTAAATIDVEGANIDPSAPVELRVESTHPALIALSSRRGRTTVEVPAGETARTVRL
ncbi:hypothetical protein [Halegenticoccus soli]|uniref:hypothetical protein n=1 Tax=Halegenticoccus soli TaxID=1985678 RepID=UPI00117A7C61|nr:hypothetical protein [Halegenticoccus soli]